MSEMPSAEKDARVIYGGGERPRRSCPVHDQRPIHPGTLTKVLWVREEITKRHADHYMPEAGCVLCFR